MTLIECFSDSVVENIVGCLRLRPEKVFLLGDEAQIRPFLDRFTHILTQRGQNIQIKIKDTKGKNVPALFDMLMDIVCREEQVVIDLAGGDEVTVMAVGALVATGSDTLRQRISVQRYDPLQKQDMDCDGDGRTVQSRDAFLTVAEQI